MRIAKGTAFLAAGALVLSGCSAEAIRGTPAASPEECVSDWAIERKAAQTSGGTTGGGFEGFVIGLLVNVTLNSAQAQAANDRAEVCLARFGINDAQSYIEGLQAELSQSSSDSVPPQPVGGREPGRDAFGRPTGSGIDRSGTSLPPVAGLSSCEQGAGVLQGGAGYCVGSTN